MDNKIFSQALTALGKQITYLRINGFPGLCSDFGEIVKLNHFMECKDGDKNSIPESTSEYGMKGEELMIRLPFAGTNFHIKLFFNLHEPWVPPDLLFSDIKFMKKIMFEDLDNQIPSLNNWAYLSEDMITQLLLQLYTLYKKYQLECLELEEVLQFEYHSLLNSLNLQEDDVEISLSGGSNWLLSMLIKLPLNLKDIPPTFIDTNPGRPTSLLHITVKRSNGTFAPKLFLSPQVEALIGNSNSLGLPSVPPGTSLTDYITNIYRLIDDRVKNTLLSFELRKQLTAQMLGTFGPSVLEYDAEKFYKLSFLLDWQDFNFILMIELPDNFLKSSTLLTLRSVYHRISEKDSRPYSKIIPDVNLPIQSSPEEIVNSIKDCVLKYLPTFKNDSVSSK